MDGAWLIPVDGRWRRAVLEDVDGHWQPKHAQGQHVHYLLPKPRLDVQPGDRLLWFKRAGQGQPGRLIGSSVVEAVRMGRAAELLEDHGGRPSISRRAVTTLVGDSFTPLTELRCTFAFLCAGPIGGAELAARGLRLRHGAEGSDRPVRMGNAQVDALWEVVSR